MPLCVIFLTYVFDISPPPLVYETRDLVCSLALVELDAPASVFIVKIVVWSVAVHVESGS
jgi:hypothetical protein